MNVENKKRVSNGITILSQLMGILTGVTLLSNAISERIEYMQEPIVAKLCGCILIIAMVIAAYILIFQGAKKEKSTLSYLSRAGIRVAFLWSSSRPLFRPNEHLPKYSSSGDLQ